MRRFALLVALLGLALGLRPATGLAAPAALGDIALIDQSGTVYHLRDLAGRAVALTFIATRCQDTCPMANAVFARLAQTGVRAQLVTISLDPAYDTPFVMANYARELRARAPSWRFLTGRPENIARVLRVFGVTVERGSDGIPDAHSDFIYVLDRNGRLAHTLPLSTNSVGELRKTLTQLALRP